MITSIYETDDIEYREFIINYVIRYYADSLLPEEEQYLLRPTNHRHVLPLDNVPNSSANDCCTETLCVRDDADEIELRYQLRAVDTSPWELADHWSCLGWMNLNFKSPRIEVAFRIRCTDRMLREHTEQVFGNACTVCGRLKRTPKAKVCMWCAPSTKATTTRQQRLQRFLDFLDK